MNYELLEEKSTKIFEKSNFRGKQTNYKKFFALWLDMCLKFNIHFFPNRLQIEKKLCRFKVWWSGEGGGFS